MRVLLSLLLVGVLFAGCASNDAAPNDVPDAPQPMLGPVATVALVDTGINPYHIDFRDDGPLAYVHPSHYLPGYPADTPALQLSLDAANLEAAREADKELWDSVVAGQLYWFPGTKVSGITFQDGSIFSAGHGTMTASRAAGNAYSLCPECRIVAVQGFNAESVAWAGSQSWIDAQSNSWSPTVPLHQADAVQSPGLADAFAEAATKQLVFGSAGNGAGGKFGVVGHPSFTRSTSGAKGVIAVGGHDNGKLILWSGSWPQVVADACDNWAAVGDTLEEYSPREGGGTSSASPYAAGAAARFVLEARNLLDDRHGTVDGVLARGQPMGESVLADGELSLDEAKMLLMKTATPHPVATEHDGDECAMASPYNTYPVEWATIPGGAPTYPFIGYGQVSVTSVELGIAVLGGSVSMPDRAEADGWHARAELMRDAYNGVPV
jgi:hypothetical protein